MIGLLASIANWMAEGAFAAAAVTFFTIMVGSLVVPVAVMLLLPGRRGTMRTQRHASHAGIMTGEAWELYGARLQYEGFDIAACAQPGTLRATRRAKTALGSVAGVHAQSNKPLEAEATFQDVPGQGVAVTLALWTTDLVVLDTGEGRYIDGVLDRLMTADLGAEPPVVVPSPSFSPVKALIVAAFVWMGVAMMWLPAFGGSVLRGIVIGLIASALMGLTSAVHGLREIHAKPAELYGAGRAKVAIVLLFLGVAAAVTTLNVRLAYLDRSIADGAAAPVPATLPDVKVER
ncbi:MAG: hypothetical protein M3478_03920 [Planctomycetota bacterium]|nr:hypothetical protein [Planctomycetota bacterium]